jgi:hypothetical protein
LPASNQATLTHVTVSNETRPTQVRKRKAEMDGHHIMAHAEATGFLVVPSSQRLPCFSLRSCPSLSYSPRTKRGPSLRHSAAPHACSDSQFIHPSLGSPPDGWMGGWMGGWVDGAASLLMYARSSRSVFISQSRAIFPLSSNRVAQRHARMFGRGGGGGCKAPHCRASD